MWADSTWRLTGRARVTSEVPNSNPDPNNLISDVGVECTVLPPYTV